MWGTQTENGCCCCSPCLPHRGSACRCCVCCYFSARGGAVPDARLEYLAAVTKFQKHKYFIIDFKIHQKCTPYQPSPIVPDDSEIKMPPLSGLSRKKALCCSLSDLPVSYDCPTKQCAAYAMTLYSGGRSQQVVKAC